MKIVGDTNILVSAFIVKNGNPAKILRQINGIELVTSEEILDETEEVLHRRHIQKKYKVTDEQIKETDSLRYGIGTGTTKRYNASHSEVKR